MRHCDVIPLTVNVRIFPPLQISISPDSNTMIIGDELKVFVIANPISSIANGISFAVAHEPTALQLDSIATPCSAQSTKTNDAATITINACPQLQSDTIATLYYQTLFGYTDTPFVRLQNVTTTNTCDTVMGSGNNIIVLSLPGCDLDRRYCCRTHRVSIQSSPTRIAAQVTCNIPQSNRRTSRSRCATNWVARCKRW